MAAVADGSHVHRVSWREGRLILHDHDLAAEEVLEALGGEPCLCVLVRDAFRCPEVGPGGVWARPPGGWMARARMTAGPGRGRLGPAGASRAPLVSLGAGSSAAGARAALQALHSDPRLQQMPAEERKRVLASLRAGVARQIVPEPISELLDEASQVGRARRAARTEVPRSRPTAEERLQCAALPALEEAVRGSQRYLRPDAPIRVGCWKQSAGEWRVLDGELTSRGGFVVVSLPARWLNRVWARGLARVEDCFVLDADAPAPATELSGEVLRWERRLGGHAVPVAARCSIARRAGSWQLAW
jgi:hypothetical protein